MSDLCELEAGRVCDGFPDDFLWGAALSAKQAEGAKGRGLTVADIQNYAVGDKTKVKGDYTVAQIRDRIDHPEKYWFPKKLGIEFYERYRDDVRLLHELGLRCFRFSISWSRVFPHGDDAEPSEEGLAFYDGLIDLLVSYGIEPIVTMYHDDMPVDMALGHDGFLSQHVCDAFLRYADTILRRYSDRVHYWIPVNQINLTRVGLSSLGIPRDAFPDVEAMKPQAVHNKLVTCAKVARRGRAIDARNRFGAMLADFLVNPATCKPDDILFATTKNELTMFAYADVQLRGEYPSYLLRHYADHGIRVQATPEELDLLRHETMDFLAISYYNSNVVSADKHSLRIGDSDPNPYLKANAWGWTVNPTGLLDVFLRYWDRYQVPLMVAENGFGFADVPGEDGVVHDDYRIAYLNDHLVALREAIRRGVRVFAYCLWSPIDMVSSGTSEMRKRYGIIYNDQDDQGEGTHERTPKDSYWWYQQVIATNGASLRQEREDACTSEA